MGFCLADALRLPFPKGCFDIVLSCGILEHIGVSEEWEPEYQVTPLADQAVHRTQFLSECLRVLQPSGVLYIDHPNGKFPIDFWHSNDDRGRPRFHRLSEKFLPTFPEVSRLIARVEPSCRVQALSPAGRFTYRRVGRRWYGKTLAAPGELFFQLLRYPPLRWLAASPLNPYLVLKISREGTGAVHSQG
jgi:SAM-dependent methyltransferase